MEENKITATAPEGEKEISTADASARSSKDTEAPLDKNVRLLSPTQMVLRRFFRSRLSIIGLIMIVGLFLFSFVGPLFVADLGVKNEMGILEYDPNNENGEKSSLTNRVRSNIPPPNIPT